MRERGRDGRTEREKDKGMEGGMKGWRDREGMEGQRRRTIGMPSPALGSWVRIYILMALGKVLRTARAQELLSWRVRIFPLSKQQKSFNK